MKCYNCGKDLPDNASFCGYCSAKLINVNIPIEKKRNDPAIIIGCIITLLLISAFVVILIHLNSGNSGRNSFHNDSSSQSVSSTVSEDEEIYYSSEEEYEDSSVEDKTSASNTPEITVSSENPVQPDNSKDSLYNAYVDFTGSRNNIEFIYDDYDGNGTLEAFAIEGDSTDQGYNNVKIYYISGDRNVTLVNSNYDLYGYLCTFSTSKLLITGDNRFLVWGLNAGGSGSTAYIYGVKNGKVYEPRISRKYDHIAAQGQYFIGYTRDTGSVGVNYLETWLTFDKASGEFKESNNTASSESSNSSSKESTSSVKTESTVPSGNSDTDSDWAKAYIKYIKDNYFTEWETYYLIYLNDDDIPELIIDHNVEAYGRGICIYSNGEVKDEIKSQAGLFYIKQQNLFEFRCGHQGVYYDEVYKIEDGELVKIAYGSYMEDIANSSGDNREFTYKWEDKDVSESEYNSSLNAVFDETKGTNILSDETQYSYDEIISELESR